MLREGNRVREIKFDWKVLTCIVDCDIMINYFYWEDEGSMSTVWNWMWC